MVRSPEEGGIKEARETEDNIIISDSILRNILPPQIKKMTARYKLMCSCECCIYAKSMHLYLLTRCDRHIKNFKDRSHNAQNRRSGELSSDLFETYKNSVRSPGCLI